MGEDYRATDTRLARHVAVKLLPAEVALKSESLDLMRREARTLAALNHPDMVTLFSVEQADEVHFPTMKLVECQSLGSG